MKILAIGNSFSQDATRYLNQIAVADNIESKVVNLYIGGCSLKTHWENAVSNEAAYSYELNGASTGNMISLKEAIQSDSWDIITLQQVSQNSPKYETYQPYIGSLSDFVRKLAPHAKQVIHQTWAYEQDSERLLNLGYDDQLKMFQDIKAAYNQAAKDLGGLSIIPSGESFQAAFRNGIKKLHRDTFHATYGGGRYLLGAVWYESLFGKNILNNSFHNFDEPVDEKDLVVLKKCAHETVSLYKQ